MEHDKFEKHIAQKIDERRLPPSANSWDRIAGQLESDKSSKPKLRFWIAAAVVAILLLATSTYFFQQDEQQLPIEVVEDKVELPDTNRIEISPVEELPMKEEHIAIEEHKISVKEKDDQQTMELGEVPLPEIKEMQKEISIAMTDTVLQPSDLLEKKALELAGEINKLQQEGTITDQEIDALLLKAQKDLEILNVSNSNPRVDAMVLLLDAEAELNRPFKEKVYELLKEGFVKAKTAVAKRD